MFDVAREVSQRASKPFGHLRRLAHQLDGTVLDGLALIGNQHLFGERKRFAKSFATFACSLGRIETEQLRRRWRIRDTAFGTCVTGREDDVLRRVASVQRLVR